ncbi:Developmental and secondary metabolism regulator [Lachnellula hyalina]|uniref:Developmental and secondary metabolism regulator n=1 Tax=Lachnellula hyalina TaxID=1316788 RepID=A0A8H8R7C7_9HELO|nr:Developmental and secondary metabolism regulator [Lachnellula hyalina]TVY29820.1 Developmental and secondary metabolism regulator [Lachnellula hyalina]
MAAATSSRPTPKEWTRVTKGGRRLRYSLSVIQEPERARACGSGAKSSADRRPVDPPPVVELRIFDDSNIAKPGEDITFSYDANFFLFATLETARPMAHGRMHPSPPQIPVLTGMPVSGMAYLDRPNEAGYFIFPDLSVRHEGRYQLSFNLYEETKQKDDRDAEPANDQKAKIPGPAAPESSFDWRLEIKSNMFTVYSAKKFLGLAESTTLSRTVAEQGCRVRIRRDVRMRRRDKAPSEYGDTNAIEDGYARAGRAPEQAIDPYRERSNSAGSDEGREPQRRLSGEYPPQPYNSQYSAPGTPVGGHPAPPGGNLGWMGGHSGSQFQAPPGPGPGPPQTQFPQPAPPHPAPQLYQTAPNPYPQPVPQYRPAPPPPPPSGYSHERPYPQSAHPTNPPREQRDPFESDPFRRASAPFPSSNPLHGAPYPTSEASYNRPLYHPYARDNSPPPSLPPLKSMPSASPPAPLSSIRTIAPSLQSPGFDRGLDRSGPYNQYQAAPAPPDATQTRKRVYDAVFDSSENNKPFYNGMRPSTTYHEAFDDDEDNQPKLEYKRADGTGRHREPPRVLI